MDLDSKDLDNNFSFRLNKEKKKKAIIVLKSKGKDLSTHLREVTYELAEEYDRIKK